MEKIPIPHRAVLRTEWYYICVVDNRQVFWLSGVFWIPMLRMIVSRLLSPVCSGQNSETSTLITARALACDWTPPTTLTHPSRTSVPKVPHRRRSWWWSLSWWRWLQRQGVEGLSGGKLESSWSRVSHGRSPSPWNQFHGKVLDIVPQNSVSRLVLQADGHSLSFLVRLLFLHNSWASHDSWLIHWSKTEWCSPF